MQTTLPTPTLRRDTSPDRRPSPQRHVIGAADARARRSGGPQDEALYRCGCGYAFKAEVSTTVGCPHCGTGQAW